MKKLIFTISILNLLFGFAKVEKVNAQLTGVKNIPGNYATLASAISDLNSNGVGTGGITLNLLPGNPQTAPAGGYRLTAIGTALNLIFINGNGNVITASGSQPIGSIKDAVFMIKGGDYITIDSFIIRENPLNTVNNNGGINNMTEWGVALLHASPINGAQNNIIKNCTISLNKSYGNTFGIYSNTRHDTIDVGNTSDITSASGANINNRIYTNNISNVSQPIAFIGSRNAAFMDSGNDIGGVTLFTGNTLTNWGNNISNSYVDVFSLTGIDIVSETAYNISNNLITTSVNFSQITGIGISMFSATTAIFTNSITNNTFTLSVSNSSGSIFAINTPINNINSLNLSVNISNNLFQNCSITGASYSNFYGIQVSGSGKILKINNNIFQGNTSTATDGYFYGIFNNNFNATDSISINNNQIGNNIGGAFSFGGGNFEGIRIAYGTSTTPAISISSNNFQGLNYTTASTGTLRFISDQATSCGSININSNTFTNLNVNTSGNITFISSGAQRSSGSSCNVNNNSIVTAFNNSGTGGSLRLYDGGNFSAVNTIETNSNNNFSNIITGGFLFGNLWSNREICGKMISNNIFNNISGHGDVNVIYILGSDTSSSIRNVSNNTISNISSDGTVIGIYSDSRATNVLDNNINSLSSTGISVIGIYSRNVTQNLFRNKIYNLQASNLNGSVNGISLFGGKVTAYNNLIGDLKAPLANRTSDAVIGLNLFSSSVNVYFNTIYLNASSTGTNFSTSGIYHTASSLSTDGPLNLQNNIIVNTSIPNGTGKTVAYRRSSNALNNYSTSSNNNSFYAGIPSSSKLIFFDGTNLDQIISTYKTRVTPRDAQSFSENPNFLGTSGSNSNFLHIDPSVATQIESGGKNIIGITDDYDGDIRNITTPDVGADEFNGVYSLNLSAIIQGLYNEITNSMVQDTISIYIRNSSSPYTVVDSAKGILNSSGLGVFNFNNLVNGIRYYIQFKHRNSIETWSDSTKTFEHSTLTIDFTDSYIKAYGNNLIQVDNSPLRYAMYNGNVNQDALIDLSDVLQVYNDASLFNSGYIVTDVNGDNISDLSDVLITSNNSSNFVSVIRP